MLLQTFRHGRLELSAASSSIPRGRCTDIHLSSASLGVGGWPWQMCKWAHLSGFLVIGILGACLVSLDLTGAENQIATVWSLRKLLGLWLNRLRDSGPGYKEPELSVFAVWSEPHSQTTQCWCPREVRSSELLLVFWWDRSLQLDKHRA